MHLLLSALRYESAGYLDSLLEALFICSLYRASLPLAVHPQRRQSPLFLLSLTLGSRGKLLLIQTPKVRNISTLRHSADSPDWYFRRFAKLSLEETPFSDIQGVFSGLSFGRLPTEIKIYSQSTLKQSFIPPPKFLIRRAGGFLSLIPLVW